MNKLQVNTRFLAHELTGVQRYTVEILDRIGNRFDQVAPHSSTEGIKGHSWEQFVLPWKLDDCLFWNPTCPGPLAVTNQVVTVHDLSPLEHSEWFDWKYALWNRLLIPILLRRVRHIITVSSYTKQRVRELIGVPEEKITVVYNGVDERFTPASLERVANMREELGLPSGPYVLSLSALQPRKNLERLISAWTHICDQLGEGVSLVLAGGAGRPTIFHNFSLEDVPSDIFFPGYVNDDLLPALYTGADAFLYPSLYEGFGLPILEAMACGTPVVTSNITSLPEVAGDAALLVNPYEVCSIANGIQRIVDDSELRDKLRKKGLERARRFTWERTAEETWQVLKSVAELNK